MQTSVHIYLSICVLDVKKPLCILLRPLDPKFYMEDFFIAKFMLSRHQNLKEQILGYFVFLGKLSYILKQIPTPLTDHLTIFFSNKICFILKNLVCPSFSFLSTAQEKRPKSKNGEVKN